MLTCSEVYRMNNKVDINVQRLDSEDILLIIYPRAPDNFYMKVDDIVWTNKKLFEMEDKKLPW